MYIVKSNIETEIKNCTTKGCIVCQAPLCSSSCYKFKCLEDSCEWRWHNIENLSKLPPPNLLPKKKNISSAMIDGANRLLNLATSARRRLTTEKNAGSNIVQVQESYARRLPTNRKRSSEREKGSKMPINGRVLRVRK